jgi:hypothetical protein
MRASQLWQDPGPDGDDLDSDSVVWQDFTIDEPTAITHLEWWGNGACELGFRIEFWPQDPGTIAYQPLAVFYYGGSNPPPQPTATFDTTAFTKSVGPDGITHYALELTAPVSLPANSAANPRWFIGIIGLTAVPYAQWNWARGAGPNQHCFRWLHGSGGPVFQSLGEGRAIVVADAAPSCVGNLNGDSAVDGSDLGLLLGQWGGAGSADLDGNGLVNGADFGVLLAQWGPCP